MPGLPRTILESEIPFQRARQGIAGYLEVIPSFWFSHFGTYVMSNHSCQKSNFPGWLSLQSQAFELLVVGSNGFPKFRGKAQ